MYVESHNINDTFITLLLDYSHTFNTLGDAASLKTLLGKPSGTKPQLREKECRAYFILLILLDQVCCLIKNLTKKTQWDKT